MPRYEINGKLIEVERELTDDEIDDIASDIQSSIPKKQGFIQGQLEATKSFGEEMARGLFEQSASFWRMADGVTKLGEKFGLQRGGIFEDWANQAQKQADAIEKNQIDVASKTIANIIGGSIPAITKFASIPLNPMSQFAVTSALEEFSQDPEGQSLLKGGLEGAGNYAAFGVGGKIFQKTGELLKRGKDIAISWLTFVTKNRKWAEDYVNNTEKYNLSLGKRVKSPQEVKDSLVAQKASQDLQYKDDLLLLNQKKSEALNSLQIQHSDASLNLRLKQNALAEEVKSGQQIAKEKIISQKELKGELTKQKGKINIEESIDDLANFKEQSESNLQSQAVTLFDTAKQKFDLLRKQQGQAVGRAIELAEQNGTDKVTLNIVQRRINNAIKKSKGITVKQHQLQGRTELTPKEFDDVNEWLKAIRGDMYAKDGVSLRYLNNLRDDFRIRAKTAYDNGDGTLGKLYENLTDAVNPIAIANSNKSIAGGLSMLREANKGYAALMPKYERALSFFYTKVGDDFRPDVNKVINAIKTNNKSVLREMNFADSMLPKEDRIVPDLTKLLQQGKESVVVQTKMAKTIKEAANREYESVMQQYDKQLADLSKQQTATTKSVQRHQMKELKEQQLQQRSEKRTLSLSEQEKINQLKKEFRENKAKFDVEMQKTIDFYDAQQRFRSLRAEPGSVAALVQNGVGISVVFGNRLYAAPFIAATSPIVAAKVSPSIIKLSNAVTPSVEMLQHIAKKIPIGKTISQTNKIFGDK